MKRTVTLESLQNDARKIRDEFAQIVRDGQHWNKTHPNTTPIDIGYDLVSLKLANELVAAVEAGNTTGPETKQLMDHLRNREKR